MDPRQTMRYQYYICDVFTDTRFGGNQLAVLPKADGLSVEQMQQIAREFNFSESTFVLAAEKGHSRKIRIFTPTTEVPFAGHPNIGTAFVLAAAGEFGRIETSITVSFEEKAGLVPVFIQRRSESVLWCELQAPESLSIGQTISRDLLASAVSLRSDDIVTKTHSPQVASVGLPFLFAELRGSSALARARMFAPLSGVLEDPATGSANCTLAGLLAHYSEMASGSLKWRIAQGVEMGRPSVLEARSEKDQGTVVATWVGGTSVLVGEGFIEID